MNNQKIALFDSGVGGLTVLDKLKQILPNENYIYFGDLKHIPYGEKSKEELIKYADDIFTFFNNKDIKAAVMACNTTSANTYEELKNNYKFKIYPIIQSVSKIISQMPIKKVGVLATRATINSGAYAKELKKHNPDLQIFEMACPPWVEIVESQKENEEESIKIVKEYLEKMLSNKPDKIILGCTHYPYLLDVLSKFAPREMFIDPSLFFAEFIKKDLENNNLLSDSAQGSEEFFVSANPESFISASKVFYPLEKASLLKLQV